LCSTSSTTQALARDSWMEAYYDCDLNVVGYHYFDCYGHHTYSGQQTGAYKGYYQEENNDGTWVPYTGQTCP
jgi:hypothetical protein